MPASGFWLAEVAAIVVEDEASMKLRLGQTTRATITSIPVPQICNRPLVPEPYRYNDGRILGLLFIQSPSPQRRLRPYYAASTLKLKGLVLVVIRRRHCEHAPAIDLNCSCCCRSSGHYNGAMESRGSSTEQLLPQTLYGDEGPSKRWQTSPGWREN